MKRKLLVLMAVMMAAVSTAWARVKSVTTYWDSQYSTKSLINYVLYPDGHAEVGDNTSNSLSAYNILAKVDYEGEFYKVTAIQANAFKFSAVQNPTTKEITIPETVKSIGNYAFYGLSKLETVYFNVEKDCEIDENAFRSSFKNLVLGENVKEYPGYIVHQTNPKEITIPAQITKLGKGAFSGCDNLKTLYMLTKSAPETESDIFSGSNVSEIFVREKASSDFGSTWRGKTVKQLSNIRYSSYYTTDITPQDNSNFGSDVKFVGSVYDGTVNGIKKFGYLEFKGEPTKISSEAFQYSSLAWIVLPSTVAEIEDNAFQYCTNLHTLVLLSKTAPTVSSTAFTGTEDYMNIYVRSTATGFGETLAGKPVKQLSNIHYTSTDGNVVTPKMFTDYGEYVIFAGSFYDGVENGENFGYLEFTREVTKIANGAFYSCNGLSTITIPNSVTSIGSSAFARCI